MPIILSVCRLVIVARLFQVAEAASSPYTWRLFCMLIWPGVIALLIVLHLIRKVLFG